SASVLILTKTSDFLGQLKSYVREENGAIILKLVGGLCILIFCMEWVVLLLAFVLRFNAFVEGNGLEMNSDCKSNYKVDQDENLKGCPNCAKVQPRVISNYGAKLDRQARDLDTDQDQDRPRSRPSKIEIKRDRGKLTEPNNGRPKYPQSGEDHSENSDTYQEDAD
uniref:Uncharacterized protein LOC104224677 n=1 Tax=Nicotiana sylvestris TaxID=4096 RepID=A0A1U7W3P2_NICSY